MKKQAKSYDEAPITTVPQQKKASLMDVYTEEESTKPIIVDIEKTRKIMEV